MSWSPEESSTLYGIETWGEDYFSINADGNVQVGLGKDSPKLDLYQLIGDLRERGIRPPILLRFSDIVKKRVELLANCFNNAIKEYEYQGSYAGVYPIKVNQQQHLLEELVEYGFEHNLGLECGSKPELLVALAFKVAPEAYIVCNGFKDVEYIETALLSQKLGRNTIIVVDRMAELGLIIEASKKFGIKPQIGFRTKLNSQGAGKWMESSGARSKFGLTPSEMVKGIETLKNEGLIDALKLLHFHIGSQIPSIQSIKSSAKEAARLFTELHALGAHPSIIDVGGGLGVDYDGSGHSESSTNYDEQEYANDIVSIIQSICEERKVPHPNIISESGRALVAHSSVLVFNVLGVNEVTVSTPNFSPEPEDSSLVRELFYMYNNLKTENINEYYNDLVEKKLETNQRFTYGGLSLQQRAKADDLYWASCTKMARLAEGIEEYLDIYWACQGELTDTYFCNFSVFQSLPDAWAVGQLFPVMPIHRLGEKPGRRATIADLTCDSDGKLDQFIDSETPETPQTYLEVHDLKEDEPYYLGVFLTGAYQETLGDLHNLFGDTDAVHIGLSEAGYQVDHVVRGDTVSEVLSYVEYHWPDLIERIRQASEKGILEQRLTRPEARLLMNHYEQGLLGYTYLEDPE